MPIQTGDLIEWRAKLWLVHKIDPSTATAFIESQDNERDIVGTEEDCAVVCNLPRDWPAILVPPKKGRLVKVEAARFSGNVKLPWLTAWAKLDEFQMGGALFLNPDLHLQPRDRLVLYHQDKQVIPLSIDLPRDFRPLAQKVKKKSVAAKREVTLYDHLLEEDDG